MLDVPRMYFRVKSLFTPCARKRPNCRYKTQIVPSLDQVFFFFFHFFPLPRYKVEKDVF